MDIETRIARLEEANRKLQAQQIASKFVSQTMFMLLPASNDLVKKLLTKTYDVLDEKMEQAGFEASFQALVRRELDAISGDIVMAFDRKAIAQQPVNIKTGTR